MVLLISKVLAAEGISITWFMHIAVYLVVYRAFLVTDAISILHRA